MNLFWFEFVFSNLMFKKKLKKDDKLSLTKSYNEIYLYSVTTPNTTKQFLFRVKIFINQIKKA